MKRASLVVVALFSVAIASACSEEQDAPIPELSVPQVASMLEAGDAVVVDANGEETRRERGIIPGARLLSSSGSYDPEAELPADKATTLVFYCGNTDCRASDGAAERARGAGYSNVNVLRAGIAGWIEAGEPVERPQG